MRRAAALLVCGLLMLPGLAEGAVGREGGCAQRRIGAVVQGTKLLSRCYAIAARTKAPVDSTCIERADGRIRTSLERLERAGCNERIDTDALLAAVHAYVAKITSIITDPAPQGAGKAPAAPTAASTPAATPAPTPQP